MPLSSGESTLNEMRLHNIHHHLKKYFCGVAAALCAVGVIYAEKNDDHKMALTFAAVGGAAALRARWLNREETCFLDPALRQKEQSVAKNTTPGPSAPA